MKDSESSIKFCYLTVLSEIAILLLMILLNFNIFIFIFLIIIIILTYPFWLLIKKLRLKTRKKYRIPEGYQELQPPEREEFMEWTKDL